MIQTEVKRALAKDFESAAFYSAVEQAVQRCVPEPLSVDTVATGMVDAPSFTVPVAKLVKHEVEKKL